MLFALFQSTHPVWGATCTFPFVKLLKHVSIHAPRVGCDHADIVVTATKQVSIHAPRVGCDVGKGQVLVLHQVSIHAPRVGCDLRASAAHRRIGRFNPRTPCGVRRVVHALKPIVGDRT